MDKGYGLDHRLFLNVEKSITQHRWFDRLNAVQARTALAIAQAYEMPQPVARALAGRDVGVDEVEDYLHPSLKHTMPDPSRLTDMDKITGILASAITERKIMTLFGDYDVDGATCCSLMARYLGYFGLQPHIYIPDRLREGYGPNHQAIDKIVANGTDLLVTLDCGTASHDALAYARQQGLDVVVIDHHLPQGNLPKVSALVNPNRADDISALGYMAAVGVTFMVLVGLNRLLRRQNPDQHLPDLMQFTDLVALGTVCDVVPLLGLNRALVVRGLERMNKRTNVGLSALAQAAGLYHTITSQNLGFALGPRINAGGRIGDAGLGATLLSEDDAAKAAEIAQQLDMLNAQRQIMEAEAVDYAYIKALEEIGDGDGPGVLVMAHKDWHKGVVGLIAARLKTRFNRPAIAIAIDGQGVGTGSARSIAGIDIGSAIVRAKQQGVIVKGGGHAMAAGLTVQQSQLGALRNFFERELDNSVRAQRAHAHHIVDAALTADSATVDLIEALEQLGPFGAGNPAPGIALPAHIITYAKVVGAGGHVQAALKHQGGASLRAIAFRAADTPLGQALLSGVRAGPKHILGTLSLNRYKGMVEAQMHILDMADPI